ncbi:MAG: hypothetical protein J6N19_01205 [Clostridium sp.]|nr:hypothetical protein [Clostridium sp.]
MGWETVIIALITSGGVTAGVELIKFFVKRSDDKHDKKDGIQAEQKKQGEMLSRVVTAIDGVNETQKKILDEMESHGEAIAGLEHDRIVHIGSGYEKRGWISSEDYDDIDKYLYQPYKKLGGNGTAERVMQKLKNLSSIPQT